MKNMRCLPTDPGLGRRPSDTTTGSFLYLSRWWMYAGSRGGIKDRLMLVEIDPDCRKLIGEPVLIFDGEQIAPTTEGPKMYKKDGYYYVLMPSGGVENGWQSCLRSRSVYGPYEYKVVMRQGNSPVNGLH